MRPALSIVIPAFNEESNIGPVVQETLAVLAATPGVASFEIILVDDGSADRTAGEMGRLAAGDSRIRVVRHERNQGFGAALRTGYRAADGECVTLLSADGEMDPRQILQLYLDMGDADLMLSRRHRGPEVSPLLRTVLTAGFNTVTRWCLGFDPSELMGVYVIRAGVLRKTELRSATGLMNTELQMRCFAMGCRVKYGVMDVRPRLSGGSKVTNLPTIARTFVEMLKLRFAGVRSR